MASNGINAQAFNFDEDCGLPGSGNADPVSWRSLPSMPQPTCRAGSGVLGNYFYIFGHPSQPLGLAFNLTTEQWEQSTPPPLGNDNWCGVTTNDAIYLIGRYDSLGYGAETQKFVPTGGGPLGDWSQVASYPAARCGIAAAWDGGNFIYAAGGSPGATEAFKYDIANDVWSPIASLIFNEYYGGGAFVRGKFYLVGGGNGSSFNREYDPATNSWTDKAHTPVQIMMPMFNLTYNDDYIIAVGGATGAGSYNSCIVVQIYNPLDNSWLVDGRIPQPDFTGLHSARWVGNGMVISAGGYYRGSIYDYAYMGMDFPGPLYGLNLILTPLNPPIVIPSGGGVFAFTAEIENTDTIALSFDAWTETILPGGTVFEPLILRSNLSIAPGQVITRAVTQFVPGGAPAGNYTYIGNAGMYPDSVTVSDRFTFEKSAGDATPNHHQGWACYGWDDYNEFSILSSQFLILNSSPNPFNPTTSITFTLPEAGKVLLTVFDMTGREVATLVDGEMPAGRHSAVFNGAGLASGVYLVRFEAGGFTDTQKIILVK